MSTIVVEKCLDCPFAQRRLKTQPYTCHEPRATESARHPEIGAIDSRVIWQPAGRPPSWCPLRESPTAIVLTEPT